MLSTIYDSEWEKGLNATREGKEYYQHKQFKKACEAYEKSIRYFKQHLETKPYDSDAQKHIQKAWKLISKLYPDPKEYEIKSQPEKKPRLFSRETLKKYKISLVDSFIEDNWKKQCDGKFGGPKPDHKTWKEFYEETDSQINIIPQNQLVKWAISHGHHALLIQLLEEHPTYFHDQLSQCDTQSLLFNAIHYNLAPIAHFLIEQNCSINTQDADGRTPLHYAVMLKNTSLIETLLKKNANTKIKDKKGCTALHWAIGKGSIEVIGTLLKHHSDINATCILDVTPLHWAVYTGYTDMVLHLLTLGSNINAQDYLGKTPLHWAVIYNQNIVAKHLIDHGAKMTVKDHFARTPLHWAAHLGNYECLELLLNQNVPADERDTFGDTPLLLAAQGQHNKAVNLLTLRTVKV